MVSRNVVLSIPYAPKEFGLSSDTRKAILLSVEPMLARREAQ